ncbi:MAG TPA: hypothetical protein VM865_04755 [Acidobacteriaceae bacterium]|jgi:uncharacterized membrane protein YcaP (DUF421 family)|nr:hypothetical protein [Acidobacteriaceae bacterium]
MISAATAFRAIFGYLFLIFIVRIVGRRPGKQLTPFEIVLVFYLSGLTLTALVREEASITNACAQIITIALTHYALMKIRSHSKRMQRILDGVPLILMKADNGAETR